MPMKMKETYDDKIVTKNKPVIISKAQNGIGKTKKGQKGLGKARKK